MRPECSSIQETQRHRLYDIITNAREHKNHLTGLQVSVSCVFVFVHVCENQGEGLQRVYAWLFFMFTACPHVSLLMSLCQPRHLFAIQHEQINNQPYQTSKNNFRHTVDLNRGAWKTS